jgi:hypothetical protein
MARISPTLCALRVAITIEIEVIIETAVMLPPN